MSGSFSSFLLFLSFCPSIEDDGVFCFVLVCVAVHALMFFHLPFFYLFFFCVGMCVLLSLHLVAVLVSSTWLLPSNAKAEDKTELFGHAFFFFSFPKGISNAAFFVSVFLS